MDHNGVAISIVAGLRQNIRYIIYHYMNVMWKDNFEELLRPQVHHI